MKLSPVACAVAWVFFSPSWSIVAAADNDESALAQEQAERIEVTGSRIKRTDFEGVAPVVTITRDDIERSGLFTIAELLEAMPANAGPSFSGDEASGFTTSASAINLRGMGVNRTLVLINGRRQASFPTAAGSTDNFVDVSDIPASAVDRIEILTGGASAIYGSDAIGGVVNIILKKRFDGTRVHAQYETPEQDGGDRSSFSLTQGWATENSSTLLLFEYSQQDSIQTYQRDFTANFGPYGDDAPSSTAAFLEDRNRRYHSSSSTALTESQCYDLFTVRAMWDPAGTYDCYYNDTYEDGLQSEYERFNVVLNNEWQIAATTSLYAMLNVSTKESIRPKDEKGISVRIYRNRANVSNPHEYSYDAAAFASRDEFRFRRRMEEFDGARTYPSQNDKWSVVFGVNTEIGEQRWDVSLSRALNRYEKDNMHMVDAEKLLHVVTFNPNDTDTSRWYPLRRLTSTQIDSIIGVSEKRSDADLQQFTSVLSGDLFEWSAGAVAYAWSVEAAQEQYDDTIDETTLAGGFIGQGGTGGGGKRRRYASAVELAIPLLNQVTAVDKLELSLATRYDRYDDQSAVGGATTTQGGILYRPIPELIIRANAGQSFRAPDMHRMFAAPTRSFSTLEFERDGGIVEDSVYLIESGNLALEEEKGDFWNLGVVAELGPDIALTLDWWQITLEGAVATLPYYRILENSNFNYTGQFAECDQLPSLGFIYEPGSSTDLRCLREGPFNAALESSEGADLQLEYRLRDTAMGDFKFKFTTSYLKEKIQQEHAGAEREDLTKEDYVPHWKANVGISWDYRDYAASLSYYYIGRADGINAHTINDEERFLTDTLNPYGRLNVSFSYQLPWQARLKLAVNNAEDSAPPLFAVTNNQHDDWPYFAQDRGYAVYGRSFSIGYEQKF